MFLRPGKRLVKRRWTRATDSISPTDDGDQRAIIFHDRLNVSDKSSH